MFSDELYYGCHACGKEAVNNTCYECGHDRHLTWLNEAGNYPSAEQWRKHNIKTHNQKIAAKKKVEPMKLYLKAQMIAELVKLRITYYNLNRRLAKIQKEIDAIKALGSKLE